MRRACVARLEQPLRPRNRCPVRLAPAPLLAYPAPVALVRVMSSALADQIAAGEVVERPASVVKELVKNALDAGARRIDVEIEGGGRRRVRVVDDGEGMAPEDARLALRRHATSKLSRIEDLESLATMGFRGEALPSIAAVSRLGLSSRPRDRATAFRVDVAGGLAEHEGEVGAPPGTQVDVRDLFWNVPARLKFLKAEATEAAHVSEWITRLALSRPDVHLHLVVEGREVLDLPPAVDRSGRPDGLERARAALGRRVRGLFRAAAEEGGVRVEAFVAAPDEAITTQRGLFVLVNRRFVKDRNLAHKRSLALREYALGLESLERYVDHEPLWRVHEAVFAVLALESEPVDPRL